MFFDCAQMGLFAAAMFAAGRSVIRRLCAAFFVTCAFILAWYAPGMPLARGLLGFMAVWSLAVVVKISFSSEEGPSVHSRLLRVIMQVIVLPSSWRATRVPAALSLRGVVQIVLDLTLAGMALLVLLHTRQLVGTTPFIGRLAAGVVLCYAGVQFFFDFARLCFLAMGLSCQRRVAWLVYSGGDWCLWSFRDVTVFCCAGSFCFGRAQASHSCLACSNRARMDFSCFAGIFTVIR
jgi:hypothetical protein